jgi:hypothetical protein
VVKASDNDYPSILLTEQSSAPTSPASGKQRAYIRTSDHTLVTVNSSGTVAAVGGSGGTLSYQQSFLSADVSMTSANTFYNGPTVTLSTGTWLITSRLMLLDPTGGSGIYALKLWDGTTVATNVMYSGPSAASWMAPPDLTAVVVVASGTPVWKVSAAVSSGTTSLIKAAGSGNISGNVASVISAVKII